MKPSQTVVFIRDHRVLTINYSSALCQCTKRLVGVLVILPRSVHDHFGIWETHSQIFTFLAPQFAKQGTSWTEARARCVRRVGTAR